MNRSRAQSQQNVRTTGGRIARHRSLEASNVLTMRRGDYEALLKRMNPVSEKGMQIVKTDWSNIVNGASAISHRPPTNFSSSSDSSDNSEDIGYPPERKELKSFTQETQVITKVVPEWSPPTDNELQSSEEDRNIVAMPVEVTRVRHTESTLKHLVYPSQETKNQVCFEDENVRKQALMVEKKTDEGSTLRNMTPDGSYILAKENYTVSRQTRLPPKALGERQPRTDMTPGIVAGSVSEVVDHTKFSFTTACTLAFLLVSTCLGWYIVFSRTPVPGAPEKKTSLLRYLLEHTYEALLQIYE